MHKDARSSELSSSLVDAVLSASRVFVAIAARSLADAAEEVTLAQYRTLVVLASRGPQTLAGLAANTRSPQQQQQSNMCMYIYSFSICSGRATFLALGLGTGWALVGVPFNSNSKDRVSPWVSDLRLHRLSSLPLQSQTPTKSSPRLPKRGVSPRS